MKKLDKNGNLCETHVLSFQELCNDFGGNSRRNELLNNARIFLKIFKSFGCRSMYVVGSFVTAKDDPEDIDLRVDITFMDYHKLKEQYPDFFSIQGIESIKKKYNCHVVAFFDSYSIEILDWFRRDKNGCSKGLINVVLNDDIIL
jgi:hypothetical protein